MEVIVRITEEKYVSKGIINNITDALLKFLSDHVL